MGLFNRKKTEAPKQEERSIFFGPLGYNGATTYTNSQAMRISACYCAVNQISNSCGVLPINIVKDNGKDGKIMYNHNLRKLLNGKPDLKHNHFNFFKQMLESVMLRGNGYALILRDERLEVTQIIYLDTEYVQPMPQENGTIKYLVSGYSRLFDAEEILDFHMHVDEQFRGISTIKYAARALENAYETEKTSLNFFKSGGNLAGIIKPSNPIQADQRKQIADAWRESFDNTSDRIPVVVMPYGVDFQAVSISPEDAELLDSRAYSIPEIARFFCIHPYKLYASMDNKMSNEDIEINYLTDTILPWTQMMKEEMENKLLKPSERGKYHIEFDFDRLLKADMKTMAGYYKELLVNGIMTPNEIRVKLNLDPIPEEEGGEGLYMQLSYGALKDIYAGLYVKAEPQDASGEIKNDNKLKKTDEE